MIYLTIEFGPFQGAFLASFFFFARFSASTYVLDSDCCYDRVPVPEKNCPKFEKSLIVKMEKRVKKATYFPSPLVFLMYVAYVVYSICIDPIVREI